MHGCSAALARTAAILMCVAALAGTATATDSTPASSGPTTASAANSVQIESALLTAMNRARATNGRKPLRPLASLTKAARTQSRALVAADAFQHESLDGSPFWTRLVAAGFPASRRMGENLGLVSWCDASAATATVKMWLASPGHRANLLNPRFHFVGSGVASAPDCSTTILTADYGS